MTTKRDSLRVWLEKNLNGNKIPGLEWKDPKKKIFRIRWKHASKHGWSSEVDGCVFREWAIYSGKFKPGDKAPEQPKIWKANFRCALNALPDIQEILEERETRGNEAQKVFHMKPRVTRQNKRCRGNSFRYAGSSSYQASSSYPKHYQDLNMSPLRKGVWMLGSSSASSWQENPPPLIQMGKDVECYYRVVPERQEAFSDHVGAVNDSETAHVLPENKIIEMIDFWSQELKEKHEKSHYNSFQRSNSSFSNSFVEPPIPSYHNLRYQAVQSSSVQTPHYHGKQEAPQQSLESTYPDYNSRI